MTVPQPLPPEAIDHIESHTLDCGPDCGSRLVLSRCEPEVLQQVEITETPTVVTEHQGLAYWCPHCRKVLYAPLPEVVVKAGLFGPRLTSSEFRGHNTDLWTSWGQRGNLRGWQDWHGW